MQPEQATPGAADEPDDPMAAIADVEIASPRQVARQRRPAHTLVNDSRAAAIARLDLVATHRQGFGECHESGLGAAEWCCFRHRPVEGDAVIGHNDARHHSVSRWLSSVAARSFGEGSRRAFR